MPANQDRRIELEFVSSQTELPALEHWLKLHRDFFNREYPDRLVHNVYFDSVDLDSLDDNLAGCSQRAKLRYRWYGADPLPLPGVLEIKKKRNLVGWKERFPFDAVPFREGDTWNDFRRRLRVDLPPRAHKAFDSKPLVVLINEYRRQYFSSADRRLRVTIDTDLVSWDQRLSFIPSLRNRRDHLDRVIVEFKFSLSEVSRVAQTLANVPIRASRHSKYVTSLQSVAHR